jgi:hypothetical protein
VRARRQPGALTELQKVLTDAPQPSCPTRLIGYIAAAGVDRGDTVVNKLVPPECREVQCVQFCVSNTDIRNEDASLPEPADGQEQPMSTGYRLTQGTERRADRLPHQHRRRPVDRQAVPSEHLEHRLVSVSTVLQQLSDLGQHSRRSRNHGLNPRRSGHFVDRSCVRPQRPTDIYQDRGQDHGSAIVGPGRPPVPAVEGASKPGGSCHADTDEAFIITGRIDSPYDQSRGQSTSQRAMSWPTVKAGLSRPAAFFDERW